METYNSSYSNLDRTSVTYYMLYIDFSVDTSHF